MVRFLLLFGLLFLPFFAYSEGAYHHYFSVEGDAVILRRANSAHKKLVIPSMQNASEKSLSDCPSRMNSSQLINDMYFDLGASIALKIYWDTFATWELRYTGFLDWLGKKRIACTRGISFNVPFSGPIHDYTFADAVSAKYTSDFYNAEGNFWYHMTPRFIDAFSFSWLVGARYFNIVETLKMSFTKENRTSDYSVNVWNDAFGFQGGVNLEYNPYVFLTWGLLAKGGLLADVAEQKKKMKDKNNSVLLQNSLRSGTYFAYFFQGYPYIEIRVGKAFSFFVHYQVFYIGGIAVADKQVSSPLKNHLNHGGHIIYHGATVGAQLNF